MAIKMRGLYAITDPVLSPGEKLFEDVKAALRGGVRILQFRDKQASYSQKKQIAAKLLECCKAHHALLIINDDIHLCAETGADGVHLGQADGSLIEARAVLGPKALIGATCHSSLSIAAAAAPYADYLAFGAFYSSTTKPDAKAAPIELLEAAKEFARPIVAIGGITLDNAAPLIAAGADMVAVVSGLFARTDIEKTAQAFNRLFEGNAHDPL